MRHFLFAALICALYACDCPKTMQLILKGDKLYDYCSQSYIVHMKLSKIPGDKCQPAQDANSSPCPMRAEIIEEFFAPLNEPGHKPLPNTFVGGGSPYLCSVQLPAPGEYIMSVRNEGKVFSETACGGFRYLYTPEKAKDIRETVKKCPKERQSYRYWEDIATAKFNEGRQ